MSSRPPLLTRADLARAFGNDPYLIAAFEEQQITVEQTAVASGESAAATTAIQDATVLTLSANEAFTNERVFTPYNGITGEDDGAHLKVRVDVTVARATGGHPVTFIATAPSSILVPPAGTLATVTGPETLINKTLQAPRLSGLGNYANDGDAAAGGVPVGGIYRDGSTLMVRVS